MTGLEWFWMPLHQCLQLGERHDVAGVALHQQHQPEAIPRGQPDLVAKADGHCSVRGDRLIRRASASMARSTWAARRVRTRARPSPAASKAATAAGTNSTMPMAPERMAVARNAADSATKSQARTSGGTSVRA